MPTRLQALLRDLQLSPELQAQDGLQRVAQQLQTQLYALDHRPQAPVAAPIELTPEQEDTWRAFRAFLQLLCDYAGWVNRDQWLMLLDIAADLLSRGPAGDSPYIGDNGNWWVGNDDTGIHAGGAASADIVSVAPIPGMPGITNVQDALVFLMNKLNPISGGTWP